VIGQAWRESWEYVIPFMALPADLRRIVYTTDESVKAAAEFQGPWSCRSPVLVAEVGGCEGVARRQGRRRTPGWMGVVAA